MKIVVLSQRLVNTQSTPIQACSDMTKLANAWAKEFEMDFDLQRSSDGETLHIWAELSDLRIIAKKQDCSFARKAILRFANDLIKDLDCLP